MSISQPAISRLIRGLEDELRLRLFEREGAHVVPTDQARALYREVLRHFAGADRIRDTARAIRLSSAGYLHIGTMPNLSMSCVPEAVSQLLALHPEVVMSVYPDSSVNLIDMLRYGQLDMAFCVPPVDLGGLAHDPFVPTRAICVMPRDHRLSQQRTVSVNDLDGEDFVSLGSNSVQRMQINAAMLAAGVHPNIRLETVHSSSVISYVSRGIGLAIIDPIALLGLHSHAVVMRPFTPDISMHFSAVYRHPGTRSPYALAFAELMRTTVAAQLDALPVDIHRD